MNIEVLLFAALRERAGVDRIQIELAAESTVGQLLTAIGEQHQALEETLPNVRVAIDHQFRQLDDVVPTGSTEIALIPPVSGG